MDYFIEFSQLSDLKTEVWRKWEAGTKSYKY